MAVMFPSVPPLDVHEESAELAVYRALQTQLDDSFHVYYRFHYITSHRPAREGEVDFLILHARHGLLALEVKGRGVQLDRHGHWVRLNRGRPEKFSPGPLEQARRHSKDLADELVRRARQAAPELLYGFARRMPLHYGYATVFPLTQAQGGNLPLEAHRDIFFDARDMERLGECVVRAMSRFGARGKSRRQMPPEDFRRFCEELVRPCLVMEEVLAASLAADEERLVRLTQEQITTIHAVQHNRTIAVRGGAGTGKSLMAEEMARLMAQAGQRVLLLCFNADLARDLSQRMARKLGPAHEKVYTGTFHSLCQMACERLGRPFAPQVPQDRSAEVQRRFWLEQTPLFIREALASGRLLPWDAVVVDEAQDFHPLWWKVLQEGWRKGGPRRLVYFYDPAQDIFERNHARQGYPRAQATVGLQWNFRQTRRLNAICNQLALEPGQSPGNAPEGEDPHWIGWQEPEEQLPLVQALVQQLTGEQGIGPEQIVVLTPRSRPNSFLAGQTHLAGLLLVSQASERHPQALYHNTIASFKGMEAEIVILADLDMRDGERSVARTRYVGASRARHRLYVLSRGHWLSDLTPGEASPTP